jgi:hypothetical protein
MPGDEIVLYGTELSGHAHRVALLLRALDLPYRFEVADAMRRKSTEFRTSILSVKYRSCGMEMCCWPTATPSWSIW